MVLKYERLRKGNEGEVHRKLSKREAIIEAAIQVFSRKGYHNTRIEEIAIQAGAGKGTIYEYFSSKLELFHEVLFTGWRNFEENIPLEQIENMSVQEQLHRTISAHLRYFLENRQLARVSFWEVEAVDQELLAWTLKIKAEKEQQMQALMEKGIARGELRDDLDPSVISRMVCALIPYFAGCIVMNDVELDPQELSKQITGAIINGIRK